MNFQFNLKKNQHRLLKIEIFITLDYNIGIILSVKYRKEKCLEIPKEIDELHKRIMTCAKRINVCHI